LATDPPIHHVAKALERPVDCRRRQNARSPASASDARLPQVGDEVFDIRRSYLSEGSIAEVLEDRLEPIVDRLANGELLREDVALFVDVCELFERERRRLGRGLRTTPLERAGSNALLQIGENLGSLGLRPDV